MPSRVNILSALLIFAVLAVGIAGLSGCGNSPPEIRELPQDLPGIKDCQLYKVYIDGRHLYIMRCPNSTASVQWHSGRSSAYSVTQN